MGSQISCSRCRSDIRAAFPTRLPVGVRYNEERACYEGLPDEWKHINQQFGVPLSQVPRSLVEGYDERIPSILLMMERFLKANNGRDQASSLLTGARRTGERSRSFCAFVRVIWTGVVRVHSRPLTFFLPFPAPRLPLPLLLPTARAHTLNLPEQTAGVVSKVGIFRLAPDAEVCAFAKKQLNNGEFKTTSDVNVIAYLIKVKSSLTS